MKFAEHLSAHITPEWRKQYITYEACIRYTSVVISSICDRAAAVDRLASLLDAHRRRLATKF